MNRILSVALLILSFAIGSFVAPALDLPVKHINGKAYYYYTVTKKDRFYDLAQKLGIRRSDITRYNPQTADGLQPGQVLTFPVELDATVVNGYYTTIYRPSGGESIYGVAKRFDIPVDKIIEFNPRANEGVKNLVLTIPLIKVPQTIPVQTTVSAADLNNYTIHEIARGETLSRIARDHGVTVDDILAANPGLDKNRYAAGTTIKIPRDLSLDRSEREIGHAVKEKPADDAGKSIAAQPVVAESKPVAVEVCEPEPAETALIPEPVSDPVEEVVGEEPSAPVPAIAIVLPFMLDQKEQSKTTQLYTEFYRGFLLATETLSHEGSPIEIRVIDSAASTDTVRSILGNGSMDGVAVAIGPDNEEQLALMAQSAADRQSWLLNIFAVKDESYKTDKAVIQANIPHERMYDKAIDGFMKKFERFTPVFLSRVDGSADKIEFTTLLRKRLDEKGVAYKEITFQNFLGRDNLEDLDMVDSAYVFVPVSASRGEFNKIAPALKNFKESVTDRDNVALFGYPEWITFRNDQLDHLHSLDAVIYSRYFGLSESPLAKSIEADYRKAYGLDMLEAVPSQGMLGYDTAVFLIKSLRNNDGDFADSSMDYDGVQSGFSLVKAGENSGLVNDNLYFISFSSDGLTTKTQL